MACGNNKVRGEHLSSRPDDTLSDNTTAPIRAVVIGAGPSGLVATKELIAAGVDVTCVERRKSVGGLFSYTEDREVVGVWRSCRLTSSSLVTCFSDHPPHLGSDGFPRHEHMDHAAYVRYLESYVTRFDFGDRLLLGHEVTAASRAGDSEWSIVLRDLASGGEVVLEADVLVVAAGLHQRPAIPPVPGLDSFTGQVLHTGYYREPSDLKGRSAVFIGVGESGEVIAELAPRLDHAYLSVRRMPFVIPRLLGGLPNDYKGTRLLYSLPPFVARSSEETARARRRRWDRALLPITGPVRAMRRLLQRTSGTQDCGCSTEVDRMILDMRAQTGTTQFETFATKTEGFVEAIVGGHCELRPGVVRIDGRQVYFADNTSAQVDTIVLGTGYAPPAFPFLDQRVDVDRLYRSCLDPTSIGALAFVGFVRPPLGSIPSMAEMQSRWLAGVLTGAIELPTVEDMVADIEADRRDRRRRHREVADRLPYLVDYSSYMDLLANEIGCKPVFRELVRDPALLHKVYTAPFGPLQYRLRGPGARSAEARDALLALPSHWRGDRYVELALATVAAWCGQVRLAPFLSLARREPKPGARQTTNW